MAVPSEYCGKQYQVRKADLRWKRGRVRLDATLPYDDKTGKPILDPPTLVIFEARDERVNVPYLVQHGFLAEYQAPKPKRVTVEAAAPSDGAEWRSGG